MSAFSQDPNSDFRAGRRGGQARPSERTARQNEGSARNTRRTQVASSYDERHASIRANASAQQRRASREQSEYQRNRAQWERDAQRPPTRSARTARPIPDSVQGAQRSRRGAANNNAERSRRTRYDRDRRQAQQSQRGATGQAPSWYEPTNRNASRTPRAALDKSLSNSRWYSEGSSDVYVNNGPGSNRGGRHANRAAQRNKLPFFIGGALAVVLVGIFAFNIFAAPPAEEQSNEEQIAASEKALSPITFTVSFAGDCTLGTDSSFDQSTSFNAKYDSVSDPSWFFANVADIFAADDLTVANMEGTLTTATTRQDKTFAFKGPAEYASVLKQGNVDAASLANNHSHDYGDQSYTDTIAAMDAAGVPTFGYDRIHYQDVKGVKVALIGTYELAENMGIQDELKSNIQKAKEAGAQVTIVYFHWGMEKETVPNETQVQLGHIAVDAGADLVIGSHPHVIQGYEKYNGRYIVYSLGNFCFGGNSNPSDMDAMIFQQTFTVTGNDVATDDAINVIPISISSSSSYNNYQPTPAEGSEKERIQAKIDESTQEITSISAQVAQSSSQTAA